VSAPIEVPEDIVERVRALCLAVPEVTVRVDYSLTRARSTARSFDIRRRSFCLLVAVEGRTGEPVPRLVLRADPGEREALLSIGHPFFASSSPDDTGSRPHSAVTGTPVRDGSDCSTHPRSRRPNRARSSDGRPFVLLGGV
jgi:hypothetical protein